MEYVIGLKYTKNPRWPASLGIMEKTKYIETHGAVPEANPNFKVVREWPSVFVERINKITNSEGESTCDGLRLYHISKESLQQMTEEIEKLNLAS